MMNIITKKMYRWPHGFSPSFFRFFALSFFLLFSWFEILRYQQVHILCLHFSSWENMKQYHDMYIYYTTQINRIIRFWVEKVSEPSWFGRLRVIANRSKRKAISSFRVTINTLEMRDSKEILPGYLILVLNYDPGDLYPDENQEWRSHTSIDVDGSSSEMKIYHDEFRCAQTCFEGSSPVFKCIWTMWKYFDEKYHDVEPEIVVPDRVRSVFTRVSFMLCTVRSWIRLLFFEGVRFRVPHIDNDNVQDHTRLFYLFCSWLSDVLEDCSV